MFIPDGYVSVRAAINRLDAAWSEQGKSFSPWDAGEAIGTALASEKLRCFGIIDVKGVLKEVPSNHWLTSEGQRFIDFGENVIKSIGGRATFDILPIIPETDLSEKFPEGGFSDANPPTVWPEEFMQETETSAAPSTEFGSVPEGPAKNRGGRPLKFDWDAFWVEVVRFVDSNGIDPEFRTECQKHMELWTARKWAEPPSENTIRDKLAKVFTAPITIKE
jgi:hypothetical protein